MSEIGWRLKTQPTAEIDAEERRFATTHNQTKCVVCGQEFAQGITLWPYKGGYSHPECVQGRPIDHGD
jgi:hypothetical protein